MSEGHPKDIKSNWKGINHNTEREISGAGDTGEYLDGKNGRITSTRGNNMSFEKIRGEEELYTNGDAGVWFCLGSITVKDQILEIWIDETTIPSLQDPIITIDGVKVAQSPNLPFLYDFPVQMDKNDNCLGGEVFITDNNTPPIIFDVKDMVDSLVSNPSKYFSDFNTGNKGVKAQLIREVEGGSLEANNYGLEFHLVAITADYYYKEGKFRIIPEAFHNNFKWTNWQKVTSFLEDTLEGNQNIYEYEKDFAHDLFTLLDRKNLRNFQKSDEKYNYPKYR